MPQKTKAAERRKGKSVFPDLFTIIRAAVSVLLLILAYSVSMPQFISILILIASLLICGFDIALAAYENIRKKDYLNSALLVLIVVIAIFCAGCYIESIVALIVYQVFRAALDYASKLTKRSAYNALPDNDPDGRASLRTILNRPDASKNSIREKYIQYFDLFSKAAFFVGVLYAVIVPFISDMTFVMSIRRGCMLIAASIPATALVSLPLCTLSGLALSAKYGVFIKDARTFEDMRKISEVIYDKSNVFTEGTPRLVSLSSPILDNDTFLQLAAYTAYNSKQRIAEPIVGAYGGNIMPEYISSFSEIPGCGMAIKLNGQSVVLGTPELFEARGISIPADSVKKGYVLAKDYGEVIEAPTYRAAMDIGRDVLEAFTSGEVGEIWMAYTVFKNTITHIPKMIRLLPVAIPEEEASDENKGNPLLLMNFEPEPEEVLDAVIPKYINSLIYGAMMNAVASENGARMTAMDNATSNAEEMIEDLTLSYNRARQGAITQEITEIVSGAEALK